MKPDEPETRALIHAGAFDSLGPAGDHAGLLWQLVRRRSKSLKVVKKTPIDTLFTESTTESAPEFPPGSELERLRRQFAVLGFLTDRHPMVLFTDALPSGLVKAAHLAGRLGRRVRLAGWLITGKIVGTKTGEKMEFLTFEDETGVVETTFFPRVYQRFCHMLDWGRPYILAGRVEEDFGAITLTVDQVSPIMPIKSLKKTG
ncbi:MAG: hypothetical protein HQK55_12365 [Deltaproteobacteria bacterium]|nr:hypothetical protein [Deltaproteobacteria bacterium]